MVIAKCVECGKEYELEDDENPEDFQCECGGELIHSESLEGVDDDINKEKEVKNACPNCGAVNPKDAKICKSCHKVLEFSVFRQKGKIVTSEPYASKKYENKNVILSFWKKQSSKSQFLSITGIFLVVVLLGVFVILPTYTSMMYDYRLSYANSASVKAQAALSQTEPLKKPIDDNIQLTKESMNDTDQVIKAYQMMYDNPTDNVTKKYAELRLKQYKGILRWQQLAIRGYEEIKASGTITGGLTFLASSGDEITAINASIGSNQNEIIILVQNNPDLRKRLINAIGQEATDKSLQPYNSAHSSIPYA